MRTQETLGTLTLDRLFSSRFNDPVAPPPGGGDFLSGPEHPGQLFLNGASNQIIEGWKFTNRPYVPGQGNGHVCILLINCTNITVRNCDFQTIGQPFAISGGSGITVEDCRAEFITGPSARVGFQTGNFLQTVNSPSDITVQDNLIRANGDTEDIISLYSTNTGLVARNEIQGDGWSSASGTGIILGDGGGSDQTAEDNTLLNPGQVGVAIAGGVNCLQQRNTVYQWIGHPSPGSSNVGGYIADFSSPNPYGGHAVRDSRFRVWSDSAQVPNGFWNPDGFPSTGNNFNDDTIDPNDLEVIL